MNNQEINSKATKKTRRKSKRTIQQIKLAVIMVMVSVLVLSASTFAWYKLNNTAKIQSMQFKADTLGNLQLSWEKEGTYTNYLDLAAGDTTGNRILLPATAVTTTGSGIEFYSPEYNEDGDVVTKVNVLDEADTTNFPKYVYKKVFYVKSGDTPSSNTYELMLNTGDIAGETGTFFKQKLDADEQSDGYVAANAVRIAFKFGEGADFPVNVANNPVSVYEPYNTGNTNLGTSADKTAVDTTSYGPQQYVDVTIKQKDDGTFDDHFLCRFTEGNPVEVTMYVWIEGNDDDCENEIALDDIMGQIQFIAEPIVETTTEDANSQEQNP
ncbi:MAG: hypothetical protein IJA10_00725 [Lachnospiraceae bacterium]|nr:hypothetical protein [Lachnospiraceae bacterium]